MQKRLSYFSENFKKLSELSNNHN